MIIIKEEFADLAEVMIVDVEVEQCELGLCLSHVHRDHLHAHFIHSHHAIILVLQSSTHAEADPLQH